MLDHPGIKCRLDNRVYSAPERPNWLWDSTVLLVSGYRGSVLGVDLPGCDINHSSPSNTEFMKEWNCTSGPYICLHDVDRDSFILEMLASWKIGPWEQWSRTYPRYANPCSKRRVSFLLVTDRLYLYEQLALRNHSLVWWHKMHSVAFGKPISCHTFPEKQVLAFVVRHIFHTEYSHGEYDGMET